MSASDLLTKGLGFGHFSLLITQGLGQDAEDVVVETPVPTAVPGGDGTARRRRRIRPRSFAEDARERRRREQREAERRRYAVTAERAADVELAPPGPRAAPIVLPDEMAELQAALQAAAREAWLQHEAALARELGRARATAAYQARRAAELARLQAEADEIAAREEEELFMLLALAA